MPPAELPASSGFVDIDRQFAAFIARFGGGELIWRAAACLSRAVRAGHSCLDLATPPEGADTPWPTLVDWRAALAPSRAVSAPPGPERSSMGLQRENKIASSPISTDPELCT